LWNLRGGIFEKNPPHLTKRATEDGRPFAHSDLAYIEFVGRDF